MATHEQLLDPDYLPFSGELRWVQVNESVRKLQQYNSNISKWEEIPTVTQNELDERFID